MTERIKVEENYELAKRTYLPGVVVKSKCPVCDREVECELDGGGHLSYPRLNEPSSVYFGCGEEQGVDHPHTEWQVDVILRMEVEIVPGRHDAMSYGPEGWTDLDVDE